MTTQTRLHIALLLICCLFILCPTAWAKSKNKSGVAPQVLTLPKGGGAVKGLGETFVPDLNSGTGAYSVPLALPAGRNGYTPALVLNYSSGRGNGAFGLGWDIGVSQITRRTEKGIPRYNDDEDIFTYNGMELIRIAPGEYRPSQEGFFGKIFHRQQEEKDFWEVWTKDGERLFFGDQPTSRIENNGQIFTWNLTKRVDPNGNAILYFYKDDGGTNRYLACIEYAIYAVEFSYEERPDAYTHYRSGFGIETTLRGKDILVRLNIPAENRSDRIRRYELHYSQSPDSHVSLLTQITQYGSDDAVFLPPLKLTYSQFNPEGSYRRMQPDRGAPPASLADPNYELVDVKMPTDWPTCCTLPSQDITTGSTLVTTVGDRRNRCNVPRRACNSATMVSCLATWMVMAKAICFSAEIPRLATGAVMATGNGRSLLISASCPISPSKTPTSG